MAAHGPNFNDLKLKLSCLQGRQQCKKINNIQSKVLDTIFVIRFRVNFFSHF